MAAGGGDERFQHQPVGLASAGRNDNPFAARAPQKFCNVSNS